MATKPSEAPLWLVSQPHDTQPGHRSADASDGEIAGLAARHVDELQAIAVDRGLEAVRADADGNGGMDLRQHVAERRGSVEGHVERYAVGQRELEIRFAVNLQVLDAASGMERIQRRGRRVARAVADRLAEIDGQRELRGRRAA